MICASMGLPAMGIMTLGSGDFIRVPLPAARMTMSNDFMVIVYRLQESETREYAQKAGWRCLVGLSGLLTKVIES